METRTGAVVLLVMEGLNGVVSSLHIYHPSKSVHTGFGNIYYKAGKLRCPEGKKPQTVWKNPSGPLLNLTTLSLLMFLVSNQYKIDYNSWPIDWLTNYIEKKQRRSIIETTKAIRQKLGLIYNIHGNFNSGLLQFEMLFNESVTGLFAHMKKEEAAFFPLVREIIHARELRGRMNRSLFDKIEAVIQPLNNEHKIENQRLKLMAQLKHSHEPFEGTCRIHEALFALLKDFLEDFELHIYLQCKLLFPKVIAMKYDEI